MTNFKRMNTILATASLLFAGEAFAKKHREDDGTKAAGVHRRAPRLSKEQKQFEKTQKAGTSIDAAIRDMTEQMNQINDLVQKTLLKLSSDSKPAVDAKDVGPVSSKKLSKRTVASVDEAIREVATQIKVINDFVRNALASKKSSKADKKAAAKKETEARNAETAKKKAALAEKAEAAKKETEARNAETAKKKAALAEKAEAKKAEAAKKRAEAEAKKTAQAKAKEAEAAKKKAALAEKAEARKTEAAKKRAEAEAKKTAQAKAKEAEAAKKRDALKERAEAKRAEAAKKRAEAAKKRAEAEAEKAAQAKAQKIYAIRHSDIRAKLDEYVTLDDYLTHDEMVKFESGTSSTKIERITHREIVEGFETMRSESVPVEIINALIHVFSELYGFQE